METKTSISTTIILTLIFLLTISSPFIGLKLAEYFSPKYEAIRFKTFKQSQAYNEGMIRDLENLKLQYESASKEQKDSLRALIIHRFSVYEKEKLPVDLELFYIHILRENN